ncbi:hypothetical protein AB4516_00785 [Vibrio sp. 10N.222.54.F12]|uniref:hypothetical protein n=1 Tax=Vibrio TaxID=662 RepID=UPI000C8636B7|nr:MULTISPECIES: hypothetical protein [Vibrio]PMH00384.1 hypothetical protein BCU78_16045 [Vibrio lentus]PML17679.1 hypothetical protein BCT83_08280 [Vibrio tasmaniensis]
MNTPEFSIQLYIGSSPRKVSAHRLTFSDDAPGRAQLTIQGEANPMQQVAIELGWGDNLRRVFTGFIERVSPDKPGYVVVFCRELAAVLYHPMNIVVRHPTLTQLLSNMTQQTGLQFVVPDKAYANSAIPCFYSIGNGYRVLDEIAQAFSISDYMWQQQGDGKIFVGSWADSYWADKPVNIPSNIINPHKEQRTATVPCSPHFKPGVIVNGRRLVTVEHKATETAITWM